MEHLNKTKISSTIDSLWYKMWKFFNLTFSTVALVWLIMNFRQGLYCFPANKHLDYMYKVTSKIKKKYITSIVS